MAFVVAFAYRAIDEVIVSFAFDEQHLVVVDEPELPRAVFAPDLVGKPPGRLARPKDFTVPLIPRKPLGLGSTEEGVLCFLLSKLAYDVIARVAYDVIASLAQLGYRLLDIVLVLTFLGPGEKLIPTHVSLLFQPLLNF